VQAAIKGCRKQFTCGWIFTFDLRKAQYPTDPPLLRSPLAQLFTLPISSSHHLFFLFLILLHLSSSPPYSLFPNEKSSIPLLFFFLPSFSQAQAQALYPYPLPTLSLFCWCWWVFFFALQFSCASKTKYTTTIFFNKLHVSYSSWVNHYR